MARTLYRRRHPLPDSHEHGEELMLWLDHMIFGNGYGLKSPHWDDKFYCLSGQLYHWVGGLGAQLTSFQWFHPLAGECRVLCGREFQVFRSSRRWLRVEVSWKMTGCGRLSIDEHNAKIRELKADLDRL